MNQITTETQSTLIAALIAFEADLQIVSHLKHAEDGAEFLAMTEAHERVRTSPLKRLLPTTYHNAIMWMYEGLSEASRMAHDIED